MKVIISVRTLFYFIEYILKYKVLLIFLLTVHFVINNVCRCRLRVRVSSNSSVERNLQYSWVSLLLRNTFEKRRNARDICILKGFRLWFKEKVVVEAACFLCVSWLREKHLTYLSVHKETIKEQKLTTVEGFVIKSFGASGTQKSAEILKLLLGS